MVRLEKNEWDKRRNQLQDNYVINKDWIIVVDRFAERINHFYLAPAKLIQEPQSLRGEGFTIVTILCVVLETIAAFKYGMIHKYNKKKGEENYFFRRCWSPIKTTYQKAHSRGPVADPPTNLKF